MKKIFLFWLVVAAVAFLIIAPIALAEDNGSNSGSTEVKKTETENEIENEDVREKLKTDLDTLKANRKSFLDAKRTEKSEKFKATTLTFAENQINVRSKVLDEQEKRLSSASCSNIKSIDVKTPVQASIDANQKALTDSLAQIKTSKTSDEARKELKSTIEETRVFSILNPAISGLCISGRMLDKIATKYDPLVTKVKKTGTDTTKLEGYLADAKTQIGNAVTIYKTVLSNTGAANAKEQLKTAKSYLVKARADLHSFSEELHTISETLKTKETSSTESQTTN